MQSHEYEKELRRVRGDLARLLILFAIALSLGQHTARWVPGDPPARFMDDLIVQEKWRATREGHEDVTTLFVGDSSCLMGFSAPELETLLGERVYNLGTLSTLGLDYFAKMAAAFVTSNERKVDRVVLLISPQMVTSASRDAAPQKIRPLNPTMQALMIEGERARIVYERDRLAETRALLGLTEIQTNLAPRILEAPYAKQLGFQYGFPAGLRDHLSANRGSAIDPTFPNGSEIPDPSRADRYFISADIQPLCQRFRAALPPNTKLHVGITPVAEASGDNTAYAAKHAVMTAHLARWLRADRALTNLPAMFPARYFSTETHLNESGAHLYTRALASALGVAAGN